MSDATITLQAIEANNLKAINDEYKMREDPEKYSQTIQEKISNIQNETMNKKRNAFVSVFNEMGRHIDMEHNAMSYMKRNDDVVKMNKHNLDQIANIITNQKYNKDLSRRQAEINDWYYQDKLETLFFLQMFFMTLLSMTIVYWLNKSGFVSSVFTGIVTCVLLIIVGIAGLYRYIYTNKFRDSRWWYKRRFDKPIYKEEKKCGCVEDPWLPPKVRCPAKEDSAAECISGMAGATSIGQVMRNRGGNTLTTQISSILSKDVKSGFGGAAEAIDRSQTQLEAETIAYLQGRDMRHPSYSGSYSSEGDCAAKSVSKYEPGSTNEALNQKVLPYF
jgi:hypothetical protein